VPVTISQVQHSTLQALAAISSASSSVDAYDLPPASLLHGFANSCSSTPLNRPTPTRSRLRLGRAAAY
jgi:hypothetical protein